VKKMPDDEPVTGNTTKQLLLICVIVISELAAILFFYWHEWYPVGVFGAIVALFYSFAYGHAIGSKT